MELTQEQMEEIAQKETYIAKKEELPICDSTTACWQTGRCGSDYRVW